jgi:hypothetical protein
MIKKKYYLLNKNKNKLEKKTSLINGRMLKISIKEKLKNQMKVPKKPLKKQSILKKCS